MIEATIIPAGTGPSNDKSVLGPVTNGINDGLELVPTGTGPSNNTADPYLIPA